MMNFLSRSWQYFAVGATIVLIKLWWARGGDKGYKLQCEFDWWSHYLIVLLSFPHYCYYYWQIIQQIQQMTIKLIQPVPWPKSTIWLAPEEGNKTKNRHHKKLGCHCLYRAQKKLLHPSRGICNKWWSWTMYHERKSSSAILHPIH